MTDVFISYAREDRDWVEKLAAALEAEAVAVWWDRQLAGGMQFTKETEARLNAAKAIVVVWSKASVTSMWVGDEAVVGREKGNLVPVAIEPVAPTLGFRGIHTIDLARWKGNRAAPEFVDLVRALKTFISGEVVPHAAPVPRRPWSKRPVVLAAIGVGAALLVAIALLIHKPFGGSSMPGAGAATSGAPQTPATSISIAVLPFDNLSGDASQKFFSDGLTEEITTALSKVPGLKVVARTSAFQFKAQNGDIHSIGQQLHATHFIEGSVQRAGDRVKITAQLIKADDATHLWAETYNRELKDIFAIQEEIAKAIAGALRVPLGLKALIANRTQDPESYQQYLQAKTLLRRASFKELTDAAALLEKVVKRDPDFAPAWALLARPYALIPSADPALGSATAEVARRQMEVYLQKAEEAAQRAIRLDPNDANGYLALGFVQINRGQILAAMEDLSKALGLDPQNPDVLNYYGGLLAAVGRLKEALVVRQQLQALEAADPSYNQTTANILWLNGQNDAAIDLLKASVMVSDPAGRRAQSLVSIYASMGRYSEAADVLVATPPGTFPPGAAETAVRLLRTAPAAVPSPQSLPYLGFLSFVYVYVGAPERSLEAAERQIERGFRAGSLPITLWHSAYAAVRKTERFKAYIRKLGLVEYWRAKGWPEFCQPAGKDDFACH